MVEPLPSFTSACFTMMLADIGLGIGGIVLPELDAIHVVIGKPQTAMVQVVAALSRDVLHGEAARDDLARRRPQGREKRLVGVGAEMKNGERLAVDVDGQLCPARGRLG